MSGTLFGVGLGPGDPELLTLKAARIIRDCPVIAWPAPDTGASFARSIAAGLIDGSKLEIPIIVPMRSEREPAAAVYDVAAEAIAGHLDSGSNVAVLCEGDPFFFGSFMYLFERLAPRYRCEIVPGVSSVMAGAAALRRPLVARNDRFVVIAAPMSDDRMEAAIGQADGFAIMKIGRHFKRLKALLEKMNLISSCGYVERATLGNEMAMPLGDLPDDHVAPYFSIVIGYRGAEGWALKGGAT